MRARTAWLLLMAVLFVASCSVLRGMRWDKYARAGYETYQEGQYAEAEPLFRRALAIWEKALGPQHPAVAQSLNNLA